MTFVSQNECFYFVLHHLTFQGLTGRQSCWDGDVFAGGTIHFAISQWETRTEPYKSESTKFSKETEHCFLSSNKSNVAFLTQSETLKISPHRNRHSAKT
jgi:hypothetical protein